MDIDGDGVVTRPDISKFLANQGQKVDETMIDNMIKKYYLNGDGQIDFNEYLKVSTE
jgi:calmodulin